MMRVLLAATLFVAAAPAAAIDPGTASGRYSGDHAPAPIALKYAIAVRLDDAEHVALEGPSLRVLLTDAEVPVEVVAGAGIPPVYQMAGKGEVHGLLLEFDPANKQHVVATILAPAEPGFSLTSTTLNDTSGVWNRLVAGTTRVTGELKPQQEMSFSFDAPVFDDKLVSTLTGAPAASSEFAQLLGKYYEALGRNDYAAARALMTRRSAADLQPPPAEYARQIATMTKAEAASLHGPIKIYVRSLTATLVAADKSFHTFAREEGGWKIQ